jgi:hypothetical protein
VYRITNVVEKKHYYGVHSTKFEPKMDIGIKYFSSSKDKNFIADQKLNPQNYKYKIVQTFESRIKAIEREIILHNLFDVGISSKFYNRSKQTSLGFDTTGVAASEKSKQKTSEMHKGVPKSLEFKLKLSKSLTGRKLSEQSKINLSKSRKGKRYPKASEVRRKYFYITPIGTFDHSRALESQLITKPTLSNWCKNNKKKITIHNYVHSPWLQANYTLEEVICKTFEDLGFDFKLKA